ncbi:hypothetical protein J7E99_19875 [Streptomyces sp. ISL-44]|uniref:hypothetical protein n=1 Tax=Streptomyces sp. ISL-44 TaxID=2819184 RepID=UPI001BE5266B|nr:hypothetical protein [Streptomyces sp. ISL-44]MBT2542903.1 hypothetical protein [Streptomyces sp. ISL-44]
MTALLVAITFPLVVGGLAYACSRGQALGALSKGWAITGIVVAAALGVAVFLFGLGSDSFASHLAGLAALIGVFLVSGHVEHAVLEERGVEISCVVREVDRRVETSTSTDAEGHTTTTTTTYYDHKLDCPLGGPDELDGRKSKLAEVGADLAVVYDPRGKVSPQPARSLDPGGMRMWVLIALCASLLLGVGAAIDDW